MKNKFYITLLIVLICACFLFSLTQESAGETTTIVTAVGLDYENEKIGVSFQFVVPDSSQKNEEKLFVVSEEDKSLESAINKLRFKLGKNIGFEHCKIVAIGSGLNGKDVLSSLDFFYRSSKLALDTVLVDVDGKAADLIAKSSELNNFSSGSIQNNLNFNADFFGSSRISTVGIFYKDYFMKGGTSVVALIDKEEKKEEEKQSKGGGGEEGGDEEAPSSGAKSVSTDVVLIPNNGASAIYKNGKRIATASSEINEGFNWLDNRSRLGIIEIDNLNNSPFNNAEMRIKVRNSRVKIKPKFKDGKMVLETNISLFCEPFEIIEDGFAKRISMSSKNYLTNEVKAKIKENIKDKVKSSLNFCKAINADVFRIEHYFYMHKPNKLKAFLKEKNIDDNVLDFCDIEIKNVNVYSVK